MGQITMVGDKMDIGGGNTEMLDSFPGGTVQFTGDTMSLSKTNKPIGLFSDQSMGTVDFVGDKMSLSRKPNRGYESGTPANAQEELPDTTETF